MTFPQPQVEVTSYTDSQHISLSRKGSRYFNSFNMAF